MPRGNGSKLSSIRFFNPQPMRLPGRSDVESQILDSARRCLLQYGSARMSMNDVARGAGVSRATVYNHFSDRDQLVNEVIGAALELALADIETAISQHESLEDQLAETAVVLRAWRKAEIDTGALALPDETRILSEESARFMAGVMEQVSKSLLRAQASGEVRGDLGIEHAAEWVTRILYSLVTVPAQTFDLDRPGDIRNFVRSYIVRGLR